MLSKIGLLISFFIVGMMAGYFYGKSVESKNLDVFKDTIQQQFLAQLAEKELMVDNQIKVTEKTNVTHQKAISDIREYYAGLLRQRATANTQCRVPTVSNTAPSIDAIPADAIPIAADCAETTRQLVDLQGWIVEQQALLEKVE